MADKPLAPPDPVKPSAELSNYLFAQSLLQQYKDENPKAEIEPEALSMPVPLEQLQAQATALPALAPAPPPMQTIETAASGGHMADLYAEGYQEVFGKAQAQQPMGQPAQAVESHPTSQQSAAQSWVNPLEINPLRVAYSKLPMALRNRRFGRPSFHAHSQQDAPVAQPSPLQF